MNTNRMAARGAARTAALALLALGTISATGTAQGIAEQVARVGTGTVRLTFTTRPDVCGSGQTIHRGPSTRTVRVRDGRRERDVEWEIECDHGPGRVVLDVEDGRVTDLRFYVGGRWRPAGEGTTDLGQVGARAAADYLLDLARRTPSSEVAKDAIFPATLADSVEIWPRLLEIARDERRPESVRKSAVFWVGQMAGEKATEGLDALVGEASLDREVREQAVFALSQRPRDEGVPALIRIAKTNPDPAIRKRALFWLGQSGDERALALFEELLTTP